MDGIAIKVLFKKPYSINNPKKEEYKMFNKLTLIFVFTLVVSICCFGLDTAGSYVFAGKHNDPIGPLSIAPVEIHKDDYHERRHGGHHNKEKVHSGKHKPADMIKLVHKAKNDLLMEKIKAKLEIRMGNKLDKAADLLIDEMLEQYTSRKEDEKRRKELEEGLKGIFLQEEEPQQ